MWAYVVFIGHQWYIFFEWWSEFRWKETRHMQTCVFKICIVDWYFRRSFHWRVSMQSFVWRVHMQALRKDSSSCNLLHALAHVSELSDLRWHPQEQVFTGFLNSLTFEFQIAWVLCSVSELCCVSSTDNKVFSAPLLTVSRVLELTARASYTLHIHLARGVQMFESEVLTWEQTTKRAPSQMFSFFTCTVARLAGWCSLINSLFPVSLSWQIQGSGRCYPGRRGAIHGRQMPPHSAALQTAGMAGEWPLSFYLKALWGYFSWQS